MKILQFKTVRTLLAVILVLHIIFIFPNQSTSQAIELDNQTNETLSQPEFDEEGYSSLMATSTIEDTIPAAKIQTIGTILLMHSDPAGVDFVASMLGAQGFTTTQMPIVAYVPLLSELTPYQLIVVWTNFAPADRIGTGNVLADYVDSGGSVIMATFSHSEPVSDIQGRFFDEQYSAFIKNGMRDVVRTYDGASSHPIFEGVTSFQSYYLTEPVFLASGATLVASYTDGVPFVAIKGQVVSMSAWPDPRQWSGDYDLIFANAIRYLLPSDVLLLYSDIAPTPTTITDLITPFGYSTDELNVSSSIPTLSTINRYQVIISWTSSVFASNNSAWGDLMADYVDSGGTLIMIPYTFYKDPWSMEGRFIDLKYPPLTHVTNDNLDKGYLGGSLHPIFDGVTQYNTTLAMLPDLTFGAKTIATYDDGTIFAALKGSVLAINSYVPSNVNGDIGRVLANAIEFFMSGIYLDVDAPTITSPTDVIMELGSTGQQISWTVSNSNPSTYVLKLEGITIDSGNWTDNQEISASLDGFVLGNYIFELTVFDLAGNAAVDKVLVEVSDTTKPSIVGPGNMEVFDDEIAGNITWIVNDLQPGEYSVSRNGTQIVTGSWISGDKIVVYLENLTLGLHIFEIIVNDGSGNGASDSVLVTIVFRGIPAISNPTDINFISGEIGRKITWYIDDDDPSFYVLELDSQMITNGSWVALPFVEISLDSYTNGYYNFTLTLFDGSGNFATDTVFVRIYPRSTGSKASSPPRTGGGNIYINPTIAATAAAGFLIFSVGVLILRRRG